VSDIKDYVVVDKEYRNELHQEVLRLLKMGYELHGGVCTTTSLGNYKSYQQAMVLRGQKENQ
jgi:hypothetical protein